MSPREAVDRHIRQRLEDTFGKAVATMIIASASNTSGAQTFDPSVDDFMKLATAVCKDSRVLDMWGQAGAGDALDGYKDLVRSGEIA
jgi:hypothetical protein